MRGCGSTSASAGASRRCSATIVGQSIQRKRLLFSLPGTPVIYYGDEIGMGDNIYLGDRDGVRTPMQWSGDRNAGFSTADSQRLILPTIIDHEYHYQTVNVEAQENNRHSLLWWMRRLIALRKQFKAFGRGTIEFLQSRKSSRHRIRSQIHRGARAGGRQSLTLRPVRRTQPG
jgi:glycosidase